MQLTLEQDIISTNLVNRPNPPVHFWPPFLILINMTISRKRSSVHLYVYVVKTTANRRAWIISCNYDLKHSFFDMCTKLLAFLFWFFLWVVSIVLRLMDCSLLTNQLAPSDPGFRLPISLSVCPSEQPIPRFLSQVWRNTKVAMHVKDSGKI